MTFGSCHGEESLEESNNLPDPVLAQEVVDNLEAALEQFRETPVDLDAAMPTEKIRSIPAAFITAFRGFIECYAASSPVRGENSDSSISAKIRQISVADRMPASFSW